MKLFSNRHSINPSSAGVDRRIIDPIYRARKSELITSETRNRLVSEIQFVASNDDFLEKFILYKDESEDSIGFDGNKLDRFSLAELGYKLSEYFIFESFSMKKTMVKPRYSEESEEYFDDTRLFDLAEIVILFARNEKRQEVIKRINNILNEEDANYHIIEHLITKKSGETLPTLKNILKDDNIRDKLSSYFDFEARNDYVNAAKLSADIVNLIFSGVIKDEKPKEIKMLKTKLISKLLPPKSVDEKKLRLEKYIDTLLTTAKNLSNDIYDVRHTEKSTLEIQNENIYKLVARHNLSIVELVLTTLKDDYVLSDDWETIKKQYIDKYKIDLNERITITKSDPKDHFTDLDDIPF